MMTKIFCFGSNLAGRHGKGAALYARKYHGAIYGQGYGLQGTSFAIPTKDANLKPLPLSIINAYADKFLKFARKNSKLQFQLTPIGTGYAGFSAEDIAPMFANVSKNVQLPEEFKRVLDEKLNN